MKIELQTNLFHRYPNFFRKPRTFLNPNVNIESAGPLDYWGIQCGDGWYGLLDRLAQQYEQHIHLLISQGVPVERWPRASQIKEKFGTLCFHAQNQRYLPEALVSAIREAESASASICETCGQPGILRKSGYWRVICDACQDRPANDVDCDEDAYLTKLKDLLESRSECVIKTEVIELDGELAVIIPTEVMELLHLKEGDVLDAALVNDDLGYKLVCRKW